MRQKFFNFLGKSGDLLADLIIADRLQEIERLFLSYEGFLFCPFFFDPFGQSLVPGQYRCKVIAPFPSGRSLGAVVEQILSKLFFFLIGNSSILIRIL